jgi:hypothetical protein
VTFFPSDIRTGYDMFLAAADSEAIYPILLDNGQVTTITGWSWSYGSWIYNYLCKQCPSPLTLWVRIHLTRCYSIQHYVIKLVSVKGTPYVSPDSRNLVFVDLQQGHVTVFSIADNGKSCIIYEPHPCIDMWPHSDISSRFRANQSFSFSLMLSGEANTTDAVHKWYKTH